MTNILRIEHLVRDKKYQMRTKLDERTVKRYAAAMKAGQEFPAVTVVDVGGLKLLVDGWHRVAALEALGETEVRAEVVEGTRRDARWLAAEANLKHGLPLKTIEIRSVFRAFINSRQHVKPNGRPLSYRDIGKQLGINHNTVRNWMKRDFPLIAARMGGFEDVDWNQTEDSYELELPLSLKKTLAAIETLLLEFQSTSDPETRGTIVYEVRRLLNTLQASGGYTEAHIF
jgi:hypothetical protein